MRVWIANPFDNLPVEGGRPLRYWPMARAFAAAGHDVTYWTSDFSHTAKALRSVCRGGVPAERLDGDGFSVVAVHEPEYRANVGIPRLWAHWRWARNWRREAERAARTAPPDLVVASSPPLSLGAEMRRLAHRLGAKTIVDVMDAWPETFERVAPRSLLWSLRRVAGRNYRAADAVTTVADAYVPLVAERYGFAGSVRRFYHGIDLPDAASAPPRPASRQRGLRLVYAGNLGRGYGLETVMEAIGRLDGATLDVAGGGERAAALRHFAASLPWRDRISFRGWLGRVELGGLLASCDIGVVPMVPESCVGVPYKLGDYSGHGLAVASSLGGESAALLARYGAGAEYSPGDADGLARAVRSLAGRLGEACAASRRMAEAEFDAGAIYPRYVAFAEEVVRGGASVPPR